MNLAGVTLLALAPASTSGEAPNALVQLVPFLLIFVVFYFIVFAPMRKKQKRHAAMLTELKNGDRVVTNGGICGTVVGLTDQKIQLRIADGVKIDVLRSAVADRTAIEA
ncbi:preprotein translocase subunit YajC [bacterium]|nr:MAG: preprotein translocase subunit YajC [bacterium]